MSDNNVTYGVPTADICGKLLCLNISILYYGILVHHYEQYSLI